MIITAMFIFFAGVAATLAILNKKQKIDFETMLENVRETVKNTIKKTQE